MPITKLGWGRIYWVGPVLLVAWLALVPIRYGWSGWQPETCRLNNCYCEPFRVGYLILQPAAAYSNLGFLAAGTLVLRNATGVGQAAKNEMKGRYRLLMGMSLILAGMFSFFSHASLTRVGEWLDLMGVYLLLAFWLYYNLRRIFSLSDKTFVVLYTLTMLGSGAQMVWAPQWQIILVGALATAASLSEMWLTAVTQRKARLSLLGLSLFFLVVGVVFWQWGGGPTGCLLSSEIPAHVFWHLFSAAGMGALYFYFASEEQAS